MSMGLIGRKCGMTRIFTETGESVPVTVIEVEDNRITQVKTADVDGYSAVQVTLGDRRPNRVSKAVAGHCAKAGTPAGRGFRELRVDQDVELGAGDALPLDQFEAGQIVDVTGQSKGKGYAGTVKRWNFKMQDATHGNSISHRAPGSIGQCQTPGRVFKGKKMAGQMGNKRITVQSLEVVRVDADRKLLLLKGAVPGAPGCDVMVRPSVKRAR